MPVPTIIQAAYSGTDAASLVTLSGTPTTNSLQLLTVVSSHAATDPLPPTSVTGCSLTWVQIGSVVYRTGSAAANYRSTVYRALGTPSTGSLTIDYAGEIQTSISYSWVEFSGVDTGGSNGSSAIQQIVTTTGTGLTQSGTLGTFFNASSASYLSVAQRANVTLTPEAGWTALHGVAGAVPAGSLATFWQNSTDSTPSSSSTSTNEWAAFSVEIKAVATATSLSVDLPLPFLDATSNFAYGVFFRDTNAAIDPGTGFTELSDVGMGTPALRMSVQQRTGEDLSVDASDTGANDPSGWMGIAAEFRTATAESIKSVVPATINTTAAVTGAVFKAVDKDIAPQFVSGPSLFFWSDESIRTSAVVTASIFKTVVGETIKLVAPTVINATATVSAEVGGNGRIVIPAQINATLSVTAEVGGGSLPAGFLDFVPEVKTAPSLRIPFTIGVGVKTGNFDFVALGED